jgi:hypothetical protein
MEDLEAVKAALPDTPVLANTGVKHATVADVLRIADGCVVGSALKVDGDTWNAVDPERAADFMERARSGAGPRMRERLTRDLVDLMLIPGLVRPRGPGAAPHRRAAGGRGDRQPVGPARQPHRDLPGDPDGAVGDDLHPHGPARLRRPQDRGGRLVRVERLGGVPERALAAQAVTLCVGEGATCRASSPTRATTRPARTRSTGC